MPLEPRERITIILPAPLSVTQFYLLDEIMTGLTALCGGVTSTPIFPEPHHDSAFHGWWHDPQAGAIVSDANVLLTADAPPTLSAASLHTYLETLKLRCQEDFEQDIVWITLHHIERIAGNDFVR